MQTKIDGRKWTHRVVQRMHGMQGEYFDFPTAGTFLTEAEVREYAESLAREQGAGRVCGARITVRARRGDATTAVVCSDDYLPVVAS